MESKPSILHHKYCWTSVMLRFKKKQQLLRRINSSNYRLLRERSSHETFETAAFCYIKNQYFRLIAQVQKFFFNHTVTIIECVYG